MLNKLLSLKPYLAVMFHENLLPKSYNLTNKQWDGVLDMCVALRPFTVIIEMMSTESHLTGGLVPGTYSTIRPYAQHFLKLYFILIFGLVTFLVSLA